MPNIVGSVAGIIGAALFFGGVIHAFWLLIVAGLYLTGFLMTFAVMPTHKALLVTHHTDDLPGVIEALKVFTSRLKGRVVEDIYTRVNAITDNIIKILPRVAGNPTQRSIIMQTATDYLPKMFEKYLSLPITFARLHPVKDGKTPKDLLIEQLDLLNKQIEKIANDVYADDAEALIRHGQFLEEKFVQKEDWMDL
jgi:hypothetical protein